MESVVGGRGPGVSVFGSPYTHTVLNLNVGHIKRSNFTAVGEYSYKYS